MIRTFSLILILSTIVTNCSNCDGGNGGNGETDGQDGTEIDSNEQIKQNIIILLDLSDRLMVENQIQRDSQIILAAFKEFKKVVKSNYYIRSNDEFKVAIAPQKDMPVDIIHFEDKLRINLGAYPFNKKKKKFEEFENELGLNLKKLYSNATEGKEYSEDYFGADLWAYFNDNLTSELETDANNILIILTDGYIYFEDYDKSLRKEHRYSDMEFLKRIRKRTDWRNKIENDDYGIIPCNKKFPNLPVLVTELNPNPGYYNEFDILTVIWEKWLTEMEFSQIRITKIKAISTSEEDIAKFIEDVTKSRETRLIQHD